MTEAKWTFTRILGLTCCVGVLAAGIATRADADCVGEANGVCDPGETCESCPDDCFHCDCPFTVCEEDVYTITQNADQETIGGQVVCAASEVGTTENAWARCFDYAAEGVVGDTVINAVTFGVAQFEGDAEDITVDVNLYLDDNGCPPPDPGSTGPGDPSLTPIGSESVLVNAASVGNLITVPFPGAPVVPAGSSLIVEIENDADGTVDPTFFFRTASNDAGECGPSYLRAAACGIPGWLDVRTIPFSGFHLLEVIEAAGSCAACTVDLIADGGSEDTAVDVGNVTVTPNDDGTWTVHYATDGGWMIQSTHLHLACEPEDFPQTKKGNPKVGRFDHHTEHDPPVASVSIVVDDPNCCSDGLPTLFAAHADVVDTDDCELVEVDGEFIEVCRDETGWGDGPDFPGKSWAMYFECQCPQP